MVFIPAEPKPLPQEWPSPAVKAMPNLVQPDLRIRDVSARRTPFKRVRIGAIFYSEKRWYQRKSARTAVRADEVGYEIVHFKFAKTVWVFDEQAPTRRQLNGISYEEFIQESSL
jgi:hypothetical protein